jgi:dihydrodipicolinate synthase/N-acetylneuraminate lyase
MRYVNILSWCTIGISGDAYAGLGLNAGCEVWYSVCGGLFPETAKQITEAAAAQDHARVTALTTRLEPLWALFRKHGGSIRVIAAAAGVLERLIRIACLVLCSRCQRAISRILLV